MLSIGLDVQGMDRGATRTYLRNYHCSNQTPPHIKTLARRNSFDSEPLPMGTNLHYHLPTSQSQEKPSKTATLRLDYSPSSHVLPLCLSPDFITPSTKSKTSSPTPIPFSHSHVPSPLYIFSSFNHPPLFYQERRTQRPHGPKNRLVLSRGINFSRVGSEVTGLDACGHDDSHRRSRRRIRWWCVCA